MEKLVILLQLLTSNIVTAFYTGHSAHHRSGVGVSGTKQGLYYARVTDAMKTGPGGGNVHEGEMIDVVEVSVAQSVQFALDQNKEKPVGMLFAIMWYSACKAKETAS